MKIALTVVGLKLNSIDKAAIVSAVMSIALPGYANVPAVDERTEARIAYYPSHNILKIRVDASRLGVEEKEKVRGVKLQLRSNADGKVLASTAMPVLKNFSGEVDWKIPKLGQGEYELTVELDGIKAGQIICPFARRVFPWENNKLGKSDVVLPPFMPIAVKDRRVSTVLRNHTMNDLGLWDQVVSKGTPLLKQPMRLEVSSGGQVQQLKADRLVFREARPTRAIAQSKWSAGTLAGTTTSEWDYDGMMKWTLEMQPSNAEVQSVRLVIPLDDKLMPLMHASVDSIRFNYAGSTPQGKGRIWDGTKADRTESNIIGSYVPYLWVGAEERGFSVFGENDRGWVTDPKIPCQELVRTGDRLEMRLNLIARPTKLTQIRRIVIGFQATPTKPMPKNWRAWTMLTRGMKKPVPGRDLTLLASGWYWGALATAHDLYPHGEEYSLFEAFARARKTGTMDQAFIDQWVARHKVEPRMARDAVTAGFWHMSQKPQDVLIYTNARGFGLDTPQGETFQNEWHRLVYANDFGGQGPASNNLPAKGETVGRRWPPGEGVDYELNPVKSYCDYAMWYHKKMLDSFVDHIYFDCVYLRSTIDTIGTEAYLLPEGRVQPACGLFDMRTLIQRSAVLSHEAGKDSANMVHKTNAAIAPLLSFARTSLSWEEKAGELDFQDRFSRDYIRAESIGLQHGTVPYVLLQIDTVTDPQKKAWVGRTAAGAMLVHELKGPGWNQDQWKASIEKLFAYGYGAPQVKVSQYWNANHPATIEGSDAVTLVLHKPGSALVVVCDYGNGGDLTLNLNAKTMGLTGKLKATNMESNQPLAATADGKVKFPLKKHDFKLILIEQGSG